MPKHVSQKLNNHIKSGLHAGNIMRVTMRTKRTAHRRKEVYRLLQELPKTALEPQRKVFLCHSHKHNQTRAEYMALTFNNP